MTAPVPGQHASPEECPCCQPMPRSGRDFDRAVVLAFLSGIFARDNNVPIGAALCERHARDATQGLAFVLAKASGGGGAG